MPAMDPPYPTGIFKSVKDAETAKCRLPLNKSDTVGNKLRGVVTDRRGIQRKKELKGVVGR